MEDGSKVLSVNKRSRRSLHFLCSRNAVSSVSDFFSFLTNAIDLDEKLKLVR